MLVSYPLSCFRNCCRAGMYMENASSSLRTIRLILPAAYVCGESFHLVACILYIDDLAFTLPFVIE